ncbi:MAG: histidine kinase [Burkholderiales bacterium]|nr:histidine kinase [Burkholderiales bacterium]
MPTSSPSHSDQPLPDKLINDKGSWSLKAQHYPVFSQTWFRYRALSYLLPLGVFTAILLGFGLLFASETRKNVNESTPYLLFFFIWLGVITCLFLGRFLATQIKRRGWSQPVEKTAIVIAILVGIGISFAIVHQAERNLDKKAKPIRIETQQKRDAQLNAQRKSDEVNIGIVVTEEEQRKSTIANSIFWFILLSWWGGLLDLRTYFRQTRDINQALTQEQLDKYKSERNQAQMQLSILASQVEPHFLFNTLSGVRAAMLSDPARGVQIIDHLVDYLRATIPQMRSDGSLMFSTVEQQFHAIRAYLGVIQTRIPRLEVSVLCPPELRQCAMPPLMLISLVENAVKHGIELKKGAVEIIVSARCDHNELGERLIVSVADNGLGFGQTSSGTGIGLSNIRERLKQLYGDSANLQLHMREGGGVEAALHLPLQ